MTDKGLPQAPVGEFVMFASEDGRVRIECRFEGDTLWLSQSVMAELYQVTPQAITQHIRAVYEEGELEQSLTCKDYLQVQAEGQRQVRRQLRHYSLPVILAVGYRVRSTRGTQFRKWASRTLEEYVIKGFVMDDERLKNPPAASPFNSLRLLARFPYTMRNITATPLEEAQPWRFFYVCSVGYMPEQWKEHPIWK